MGQFRLTPVTLVLLILSSPWPAAAQTKPTSKTSLTRTTIRHENVRFAPGGRVTLRGGPAGAISIEGWQRNEVDVVAEIELHANTESDLSRLAVVNNFGIDEEGSDLRVVTTGTHDKAFMKRYTKDFPKSLMTLPWKIDYRVKVPASSDLEINAGSGPIEVSGVAGAMRINAVQSEAVFSLIGGEISVIIQRGSINLNAVTRNWRGLGADIRLAAGDLTVTLPAGFSANIDAEILRRGQIEIAYPSLAPREQGGITERSVRAQAGSGGATLSFTVTEGTIRIVQNRGR